VSDGISSIVPSDDSGSTTFERYCYQAHIAFPYCLDCALGGAVASVVPEHLEDVAVEFTDGWRFLQIKTRDLERGPWRIADLSCKGGALWSALRTHRALGLCRGYLEIHLEGVADRKDPIRWLIRADNVPIDVDLVSAVEKDLKIDESECRALLARLRLIPSHPGREFIQAQNLRMLGSQARHLPAATIEDIYDRILALIFTAMQARLLPKNWKSTYMERGMLRGSARERFAQKRLGRDSFASIIAPIVTPPQPLLKRIINTREQRPTVLEQKLIVGGASSSIIEHAKLLRANASERELEILSSQMYDDRVLEDVQRRLLIRVDGLVNQYGTGTAPAATIWNQLLQLLAQQRDVIDSRGAFAKDPDLLLGQVCSLSDQCKSGWGFADA
jgi:hypothetical protein